MLTQAKIENLVIGEQLHFSAGKGVYHVEALVEVIQKADELNGKPVVVKIVEVTKRAAQITARTYFAGKTLIPTPEELFVVNPDVEVPDTES